MEIAFESEAFLHASGNPHKPFDIWALLSKLNDSIFPNRDVRSEETGIYDVDAGQGHLEVISKGPLPLKEAIEAQQYMCHMLHRSIAMPKNVCACYAMTAPWFYHINPHEAWNPKERYKHLREGVRRESSFGYLIDYMSVRSSTHFNVRLDPLSNEGLMVLSILNSIGPYLVDKLGERHDVETRGLLGLWQLFARPERFSHPAMWFPCTNALKARLALIPRLVECVSKEEDIWRVDLESPTGFHDPVSLGFSWWDVRPKVNGDTNERYIEIRLAPPMDPCSEAFVGYTKDMCEIVEEICEITPAHLPETMESGKKMFAKLHERFPKLTPERPLSAEEWETAPSRRAPAWYPVPRKKTVAA